MSTPTADGPADTAPTAGLGEWSAAGLVFGSSAAVLVVELVALRLLAPYLGLTLETNTIVIGIALTAIAAGSWAGGRAADTVDPRRALAPLLAISGAVVALTPVAVRATGATGDGALLLPAAAATIFVPGALLSAVTPMVTKLRLSSLAETGTVVGRLSGIGTAGAIVGTVVTGFVLVSTVPVSSILVGLGVLLVLAALGVGWRTHRARGVVVPALVVVAGGLVLPVAPGGCDVETTYHCAVLQTDPENPDATLLVLDGVRNSSVEEDPEALDFTYVQAIASVLDSFRPAGEPLSAYHLGAGALSVPRYLAATRPGTTSTVSEVDPGVVRIDAEQLGLDPEGVEVRVEDGRLGLREQPTDAHDVVVGDAFGGVSVPWHLTTREAMSDVRRTLADDGVYVANLIDHGSLDFARAEVRTLGTVFDEVALAATPAALAGEEGGNLVALASDAPLDVDAWSESLAERDTGWEVATGDELDRWTGDAVLLTDEFAPTDQLLTPYPTR
ncbi:fused MFS/spermidine synthase [uncultured Nocardioides sp.]|uniref:fused MFS/spermidine synthase n=1 Tax=uncultured Nocardioides sp. TaxID=198441 RepID=UPI002627E715|nr:fused MFS/spermidine synthase [uncultured Nocardioides sp.]